MGIKSRLVKTAGAALKPSPRLSAVPGLRSWHGEADQSGQLPVGFSKAEDGFFQF